MNTAGAMWLLVGLGEAVVLLLIILGAVYWAGLSKRMALNRTIDRLKGELEEALREPEPEPEPEEPEPEEPEDPRLVLLEEDELEEIFSDVKDTSEALKALISALSEKISTLQAKSRTLQEGIETLLTQHAETATLVGGIKGSDDTPDDVKERLQGVIDRMREADDLIIAASDTGLESDDELVAMLGVLEPYSSGETKLAPPMVASFAVNELLIARSEQQSEEEMEAIKERIRNPPEVVEAHELVEAQEQLEKEREAAAAVRSELEQERGEKLALAEEKASLEISLDEVTEEYQKLFEEMNR